MSISEPSQEHQEDDVNTKPHKWWQWVLLYPALFVSVFAAVPTYVETFRSAKIGVQYGESKNAIKQADLWRKNLSCASAPLDPLVTPNNTKVDATICKSGDVLVKIFTPEGDEYYQWVGIDRVITKTAFNVGFIKSAYAGNSDKETILLASTASTASTASNARVLCQKYLDSSRILRRVSVPGQGCFDEIINTYTGRVESKRAAPCNSLC
ncbi:hypothetical protein [Candidatus Thiosymbion oneisti]|uniref:hypothetical protein n=1 Tax=Candidatus Thiosymbion oneisti TaxID=589554 RepID=UPI00114D1D56|nr:hypothetical protein [Candidatus Thiosymbion oneisti]